MLHTTGCTPSTASSRTGMQPGKVLRKRQALRPLQASLSLLLGSPSQIRPAPGGPGAHSSLQHQTAPKNAAQRVEVVRRALGTWEAARFPWYRWNPSEHVRSFQVRKASSPRVQVRAALEVWHPLHLPVLSSTPPARAQGPGGQVATLPARPHLRGCRSLVARSLVPLVAAGDAAAWQESPGSQAGEKGQVLAPQPGNLNKQMGRGSPSRAAVHHARPGRRQS